MLFFYNYREIVLDDYENENDESTVGSIKFAKGGNTNQASNPFIGNGNKAKADNKISNNAIASNGAKNLIDDMADIFGTSGSKGNTGNDFFGGIDLTSTGSGVVNNGSNTGGNINIPNTNDLMSSLGAVSVK